MNLGCLHYLANKMALSQPGCLIWYALNAAFLPPNLVNQNEHEKQKSTLKIWLRMKERDLLSSCTRWLKARYTDDYFPLPAPRKSRMHSFRAGLLLLTGLLLAGLLAGCGQKGPLYLPKQQPQASSPESPSSAKP